MIFNDLPFNMLSINYNRFYDEKILKLIKTNELEFGQTRDNK